MKRLLFALIISMTSGCGASSTPTAPSDSTAPQTPITNSTPPAAVRWVGNSPDGMVVELDPGDQCPAEFDLELNLTTSGTTVTGTATTRLRRVEAKGPCGDVLGQVSTYNLFNGRIESDRISFDLGNLNPHRFAGTVAATRMTGTFELAQFGQSGRFVVARQ